MLSFTKRFSAAEDGAVTVDWVVMTAAMVGLGIVTLGAVRSGVAALESSLQVSLISGSIYDPNWLSGSGKTSTPGGTGTTTTTGDTSTTTTTGGNNGNGGGGGNKK